MNALEVKSISKRYGASWALNRVNMTLPPGEISGILGANGAGKTSFLRIVAGLQKPDEGQLEWPQDSQNSEGRSTHLGYLPEERGLYPRMSVARQLEYLGQLRGLRRRQAQEAIQAWLERLGLSPLLHARPEELSKGQAQLIQFIAAVLHRPRFLILDEPFSGFDLINTARIVEEIQALRQAGTTILLATHRLNWAAELCSQATLLHQGEVLAQGSMAKLLQAPSGVYEARLEEVVQQPQLPTGCTLVRLQNSSNSTSMELEIEPGLQAQELIKHLSQHYALSSFQRKENSLHDLFLRKVAAL